MTRGLVLYVSFVVAAGAAVLASAFPEFRSIGPIHVAAWILVSLLAESLWLSTITGKAMESMASTVDLSLLVLLGYRPAVWIVAIAFAIANIIFSRRTWYKAIFNAGQNVIALSAAGIVFHLLGGVPMAEPHAPSLGLWLILPWASASVVYFLVNTILVAGAVAMSSRRRLLQTWREEYLYYHSLVSSTALFFLSPLVVVSYMTIGYYGLIFFFVPLLLIKEASARYIALERAKDDLISTERLAAKGEMAAEIGHELNNSLAAISARAQFFLMGVGTMTPEKAQENAKIIFDQAKAMGVLAKGLMDASHKEVRKQPTRLNEVIRKTIEYITPLNKYERVEFNLDLSEDVPSMNLDPGQMQQVLLNLFSNSADALQSSKLPRVVVRTRHKATTGLVEITVEDNGPGLPAGMEHRIFEPHFTTKPEGHGFGLSGSYRIIQNHGGRISAQNVPGSGARFTITLPGKNGL
ncbi:MAG TPA: ATP-binding protein [Candidatus Polarisedimenticolia bacterium]|nr:ATP-binding protein [Candidatus Polarisedimenticolia bacterium]